MLISGVSGDKWKVGSGDTGPIGTMVQTFAGMTYSETGKRAVEPIDNVRQANGVPSKAGCGAMFGIFNGWLIFVPNSLGQTLQTPTQNGRGDFCDSLKASYQTSGDVGNRITPLSTAGTIEW